MTVSFDLISPFDSNGEIVPSWDNLRRFEKSDRWRIFVPPPEVHLLVVAQIGHNMPPFDIMDVVKLVPQRSPLLISQWSGLRFCLTSHGRGVEELVDRWRRVRSNLRICFRELFRYFCVGFLKKACQEERSNQLTTNQCETAKGSAVNHPNGQRRAVHLLHKHRKKSEFTCSKKVQLPMFWQKWVYLLWQLDIQVLYGWREVWVLLRVQYHWALANNKWYFDFMFFKCKDDVKDCQICLHPPN